jgi:hypothetical protein
MTAKVILFPALPLKLSREELEMIEVEMADKKLRRKNSPLKRKKHEEKIT